MRKEFLVEFYGLTTPRKVHHKHYFGLYDLEGLVSIRNTMVRLLQDLGWALLEHTQDHPRYPEECPLIRLRLEGKEICIDTLPIADPETFEDKAPKGGMEQFLTTAHNTIINL